MTIDTAHAPVIGDVPKNEKLTPSELHHVEAHHDVPPEAHSPAPSYWPIFLALAMGLLPGSAVLFLWGGPGTQMIAWAMLIGGLALAGVPLMGWCHAVIRDKWHGHFIQEAQFADLATGTLLFFISELAIFGSIFAYYFTYRLQVAKEWPLPGTPDIKHHLALPAIATLILMTSSITAEFAHKSLIRGRRGLSKSWFLLTLGLGVVFLGMQGYEWGWMINFDGFTVSTNTFGTIFYILTGFHAMHVMVGIVMLLLVYARLEMGHYSKKRHFSINAASWYWHLVDVVWVFLFFTVYLI